VILTDKTGTLQRIRISVGNAFFSRRAGASKDWKINVLALKNGQLNLSKENLEKLILIEPYVMMLPLNWKKESNGLIRWIALLPSWLLREGKCLKPLQRIERLNECLFNSVPLNNGTLRNQGPDKILLLRKVQWDLLIKCRQGAYPATSITGSYLPLTKKVTYLRWIRKDVLQIGLAIGLRL